MGRQRGFVLQAAVLLLGLNCFSSAARAFLAPVLPGTLQARSSQVSIVDGHLPFAGEPRDARTARPVVVEAGLGGRVLQAVSAGAVAAVVQALLSAVTEPIVNRVLVKRMKVADAIAE